MDADPDAEIDEFAGNSGNSGPRTSKACEVCRRKKVKCDGQFPCQYCAKRRLSCVFTAGGKRKLFSVSEIEQLQHKVARYEGRDSALYSGLQQDEDVRQTTEQSQGQNKQGVNAAQLSSSASIQSPRLKSVSHWVDASPSRIRSHLVSAGTKSASPGGRQMAPESALSSSDHFGSQVHTLVASRSSNPGTCPTAVDAFTPESLGPRSLPPNLADWPTLEESHELLDLVVLNVGISQQLFDIRAFSDTLLGLYRGAQSNNANPRLQTIQALLVMAVGRLLQAKAVPDGTPGQSLYQEAIKLMPCLSYLRSSGVLGIEVLALCALWLQIADRKEEAYLQASLALRLAIANGMHKSASDNLLSRSEAVHRNRLWWSLYMQERRLAAAGGYPLAIHDKAITVDPPTDASGYSSSLAIAMNVRAARITGQITWTIYTYSSGSEASFLEDVQNIFQSLNDLERSMPIEYEMDFEQPQVKVGGLPFAKVSRSTARTSSSLYLSIYQAIIHAGRPVLLHMARQRFGVDSEGVNDLTPSIRRLAEICVEAASKSLFLLQELKDSKLLAKNAFLDLDSLFSVAFVFVLVKVIASSSDVGVKGIEASRHILHHLSSFGNHAAAKRLTELNQMCSHLGIRHCQPPQQGLTGSVLSRRFSFDRGFEMASSCPRGFFESDTEIHGATRAALDTEDCEHIQERGSEALDVNLANVSMDLDDDIFCVFQPGVYTGAELADWEMLESQIFAG